MYSDKVNSLPTASEILHLYRLKGHILYSGEAVSQLNHALQCATLAEAAQASPQLIVACLLHDIGHLLNHEDDTPAHRRVDDRHEYRAIPYLRSLFSVSVTEPIRLHVLAKRYLCAIDADYWDSLSSASKQSLELQGGVFSTAEVEEFIVQPYALQAIELRRWDDRAKIPNLVTPDFNHFMPLVQACALVSE